MIYIKYFSDKMQFSTDEMHRNYPAFLYSSVIRLIFPADYSNNSKIQNWKNYIEENINLQKTVKKIEAKMNRDSVNQIVVLFHKEIHDKAEAGHYDNIWNHIRYHLPAEKIWIHKPQDRVPESPDKSLDYWSL